MTFQTLKSPGMLCVPMKNIIWNLMVETSLATQEAIDAKN